MLNKKLRILSVATALFVACTAFSGALSVAAFENGQSVGIGSVTSSSSRSIDGEDSGLTYSEAVITGTSSTNYSVHTVTFNPKTSDYLPLVYTKFSGYGCPVLPSGQKAEEKGYDIKAGVNGSLYYMYSGSTYGGVGISDGKIIQGDNSWGTEYVLAFNSDGTAQIVYSDMEYTLKLNGEEQSRAMGHINIRPAPESASGNTMKTDDKIYYFDSSCGTATDSSIDGVEVVFEKTDNTELVVGGTLKGKVVEIRNNSSASSVGGNQFILYARNSSEWADVLGGLQIGDTAELTAEESQAAAKSVMEKCNSSLVIYGNTYPLVENGKSVYSKLTGLPNTARPRTGVGVKADGTLMFFAVEGDGNNGYAGMTFTEFANLMISQGIVTGINFDGGGSTQMIAENASGTLESAYAAGKRYVANSVFVIKRPSFSDAVFGDKRETLADLIQQAEAVAPTAEALDYAKEVYETATSMPGDYTKAIMALQKEIGKIIITDLPSTAQGVVGSPLTLSIEATPIGGGTLSYQWYKDNAAIEGATDASYTINSVAESDAGKYKVIVTNTIEGGAVTQVSSSICKVEVDDGNSLLKGLRYTTSLRDGDANAGTGDFNGGHQDVARVKLTDGLYATQWSDDTSIGYHSRNPVQPVDITFHISDTPKAFSQVKIGAISMAANGITLPSAIKIQVKNGDGAWETIYDGETTANRSQNKRFVFSTENGKSVKATDIRFDLSPDSSWVFLDEIEVLRDNDGSTPDGTLSVPTSSAETPSFTTNLKTAQSVKAGETLTLSVAAAVSDGGTLSYQWYKDGAAISGATKASYTIASVQESDKGSYKVVVTNTLNGKTATATSNVCTVTVEAVAVPPATPSFTTNLKTAQSVKAGASLTLSVAATVSDGGTLSYQWYKDGAAISGATKASYTIASVKESDKGSYKVVVKNTLNGKTATATSNICAVTVEAVVVPPAIPSFTTNLKTAQSVKAGETLTLSVAAAVSDGGTLSYQWYKDGAAISGATKASYTIASVQESDKGSYKVVVTNTLNGKTATATSNVCAVTVEVPVEPKVPTIASNLSGTKSAKTGDQVTLAITAVSNNNGTLTYQWYKDGTAISGATSPSYTMASVSKTDSGIYYVDVMDNSNDTHIISNACTLTVTEKGSSSGGGSTGGGSIGGGSSGGGYVGGGSSTKPSTQEDGWKDSSDGNRQYFENGKAVTGWKTIQSEKYYFNAEGRMQTGWLKDGGSWYYLGQTGVMKTGWVKDGNAWYYLNSGSGKMTIGWLKDGNTWYYLRQSGAMANTEWIQDGNNWYYLRGNGAMATGWLQQSSNWYYLKGDGSMAHDQWLFSGGKYYYLYSSGRMAKSTTVNGYKVDANGVWIA